MIMLFYLFYGNSTGPIAWMYVTETNIDIAVGLCLMVLYGTSFILSTLSPILMEDDVMGPSNVFFMFSGFSFLGGIYS